MKRKQNKTQPENPPKLLSFVGRSNSGKTTLLTKLIPKFKQLGLTVGTIKNTHHDVEFDKPGKDSWKYAQAGSDRILVSSGSKLAIFTQSLEQKTLNQLSREWFWGFDLVISEGFKNEQCFKIEVVRASNNKTPLYKDHTYNIKAVVTDTEPDIPLPCFGFNQLDELVDWVCNALNIESK